MVTIAEAQATRRERGLVRRARLAVVALAWLLAAGVALVWVINPRYRTVTVYRPDAEPEMFNIHQELSGDPHMPGFRVRVADIFAR